MIVEKRGSVKEYDENGKRLSRTPISSDEHIDEPVESGDE